jgi:hypothetical protein
MARKANPAGHGGAAVLDSPGGLIDRRDSRPPDSWQDQPIDPRLVFLERAEARAYMVRNGVMDLAVAFDGLVDAFEEGLRA